MPQLAGIVGGMLSSRPCVWLCAGDIFLLDERDIIHTNLSVREGLGECGLNHRVIWPVIPEGLLHVLARGQRSHAAYPVVAVQKLVLPTALRSQLYLRLHMMKFLYDNVLTVLDASSC